MRLTADEQAWVKAKWDKVRRSQRKADLAGNEWTELNQAVNEYLDRKGIEDVVQRAKIKGENLALKDALAVGNWHSAEASRHILDLNLFLRLRELEIL